MRGPDPVARVAEGVVDAATIQAADHRQVAWARRRSGHPRRARCAGRASAGKKRTRLRSTSATTIGSTSARPSSRSARTTRPPPQPNAIRPSAGGAEVMDQRPGVGDALAAGPAELIEDVGHRLGDHHVARGHRQSMAQGPMAGERGAARQDHGRRRGPAPPGIERDGSSPSRRGGRARVPSKIRHAPLQRACDRSPSASLAGMDGRRAAGRRRRRETAASRSAPRTSASVSGRQASGSPSSSQAARHLAPGAVIGGGGRDLQVSGPAKPGVDALLLAPAADAPRPRRRAARATSSAAASPKRLRRAGRLNHISFTKPPLRPLGPAPQRSASTSTTRASGSSSDTNHAVHMPV